MILKKIVDWISYDRKLETAEDVNSVNTFERTGRIEPAVLTMRNSDVNPNDETRSSSSLGGETSVLDFCQRERSAFSKINVAGNIQWRSESNDLKKNHGSSGSLPIFGIPSKQIEESEDCKDSSLYVEKNSEKCLNNCNFASENKLVFKNEQGSTESSLRCNPDASNNVCLSPFCKSISEFRNRTVSDVKHTRSAFTQTDKKHEKRRRSSIKDRHNVCPSTLPEIENKNRSSSCMENRIYSTTVNDVRNNSFVLSHPIRRDSNDGFKSAVYGNLFVLGCNGIVPVHMVGKINNKFTLRKRLTANGLTEAFTYTGQGDEPASISPAKHTISYRLPSNRSVVVAYKHDKLTDMFQIGRYEKYPIDFKLNDINESDKARNGVSRFACRIIVHREKYEAKVYAAAFDSSDSIFLGEGGITCSHMGKMDGFTTNGVLIMHPLKNGPGVWREVSVCGYIYPLRSPELEMTKRPRIPDETNVLQDGTLIDLCGITLLWRTPEGLEGTPSEDYLRRLQNTLHKSVPECHLPSLNKTLSTSKLKWASKKAYVYLSCGHVIGLVLEEPPENLRGWSCPVCRVVGPLTELMIGVEPGFYVDEEFPTHVFKPCGHVASFKTVEYWSAIRIPNHREIQDSFCPFCGIKLNYTSKYVKLTLPPI